MAGMIINVVEYLLPINAVMHANKAVPQIEPIEKNADIQEICWLVSGPDVNGASGAINIGIIGVIQPLEIPAARFNRLTTQFLEFSMHGQLMRRN